MSRSYRKNPFTPIIESASKHGDKYSKGKSNKKYRSKVRDSVKWFYKDVDSDMENAPEWLLYHDSRDLKRDGNLRYRGYENRKKIRK